MVILFVRMHIKLPICSSSQLEYMALVLSYQIKDWEQNEIGKFSQKKKGKKKYLLSNTITELGSLIHWTRRVLSFSNPTSFPSHPSPPPPLLFESIGLCSSLVQWGNETWLFRAIWLACWAKSKMAPFLVISRLPNFCIVTSHNVSDSTFRVNCYYLFSFWPTDWCCFVSNTLKFSIISFVILYFFSLSQTIITHKFSP